MLAAQNLWQIRVQGRLDIFKNIKKELYQMEEEIKAINNLVKARKALEHFALLLKDMESNSIQFVKET